MWNPLRLLGPAVLIIVALLFGATPALAAAPTAAPAAAPTVRAAPVTKVPTLTGWCRSGRCFVGLNKGETKAFGNGKVYSPPSFVTGVLRGAYYALAYTHKWIAKQYAGRGWCSAFLFSVRPWENQGYTGYRC